MLALRIALLLTFSIFANAASAAPAMWLVSDNDSKMWLFGSVHVLSDGLEWRTPLLEDVLAEADEVYFEADVSSIDNPGTAWSVLKSGASDLGKKLDDYLTPEQFEKVTAAAKTLGVPISYLMNFKPWMAATVLQGKGIAKEGLMSKGVDMTLMDEVDLDRQAYLETVDFQLSLFSGMSDEDQVKMLMETLADMDKPSSQLNDIIASWVKGDGENDAMVEEMGKMDAAFSARLFSMRNHAWVDKLLPIMKGKDETALVVVGAGHMAGKDGLPELFRQAGYKVERVQ
jgi:uncharacterized protein YbaP (TraB family)